MHSEYQCLYRLQMSLVMVKPEHTVSVYGDELA